MPPRARITAPGAERVVIRGIVAVSDSFDRVRLMVLDYAPDGRNDYSAATLRRAAGVSEGPFELRDDETLPPWADGVRGTCWFVLPKHHKKHWLETATELRGRWVEAEATVRRFNYTTPEGVQRRGFSMDLVSLSGVPAA